MYHINTEHWVRREGSSTVANNNRYRKAEKHENTMVNKRWEKIDWSNCLMKKWKNKLRKDKDAVEQVRWTGWEGNIQWVEKRNKNNMAGMFDDEKRAGEGSRG